MVKAKKGSESMHKLSSHVFSVQKVKGNRGQIFNPLLGDKVDSGIGCPCMVNVLESTLESTQGEVIYSLTVWVFFIYI
jgi:hypothetical protein